MTIHENRLLTDDSHKISILIFSKLGKMSQNLSAGAVVIGALRVNMLAIQFMVPWLKCQKLTCALVVIVLFGST